MSDEPEAQPPAHTQQPAPWRTPEPTPNPPTKPKKGGFLHELPILILIAFGLALLIKTFLAQAFYIPSESMLPTLEVGDRVLVNKLVYRFREPRRGEVIVFIAERDEQEKTFWQRVRSFLTEGLGVVRPAEKDFIKRVIGLPGETIEIDRKGKVFITPPDGSRFRLDEPYVETQKKTPLRPTVVPDDSYFVMGDNRPNSSDSTGRLGPILRSDVIGKAFITIWPPSRMGFFHTPSYGLAFPLAPLAGAGLALVPVARRRRRAA